MIQLTKQELICSSDVESLARQFEQTHTIRFPQLLHPELIQIISSRMESGNWVEREYHKIGLELVLTDVVALTALHFATNTPQFLRLVERITQTGPIVHFGGRVYRMVPNTDHHDNWHSDDFDARLVGMSINLSPHPYSGGVFQLRKADLSEIICELPNVLTGDAILFRISRRLMHRVSAVEGDKPKTAFAGWFKSGGTDFFSQFAIKPK